ncbi:MAG: insulinase family protein, partial [Bacteroidales bacterium]|nr:insulinase family protein [Bacteroidales bacterium]
MLAASCSGYKYETVKGDPLKTKIYTLDNGIKVYMSVDKSQPRLQTVLAFRVGGKNDPAVTTGMAHYFEHLMFKGTKNFGTSDYEAEKPLLDEIESLFEVYRVTTDEKKREAIYHRIDSLSYEASLIAIPNEYDKLMATIGADGTNAFTSQDMTCYVEDIPSNQIENWARIQADRIQNPVIRGFHTELETIYEEKNMSLTQDSRKVYEALDAALFPHHPYGRQTVLGTQDHLKNPSITLVRQYHDTFYVPNNMAICVAGDFDPDYMVATIEKYFGAMEPNPNIPSVEADEEQPITAPVVRDIYGLESENVTIGWRLPGSLDESNLVGEIASSVFYNGMAGLVDNDLIQTQKVLSLYGGINTQPDYSMFLIQGRPKNGQTLEEIKALALEEVAKLKAGDFEESLVKASINQYISQQMGVLESNRSRALAFAYSFIAKEDWADNVASLDKIAKVTKEDIVAWANQYLGEENYACIYKRKGEDKTIKKISAPAITPIATNRDKVSAFVQEIQAAEVKPIEPVFVNFSKEMSTKKLSEGCELLYKKKEINDLFSLQYRFNVGKEQYPALALASSYFEYLGTPTATASEIKAKLYELACEISFRAGQTSSAFTISGLKANMAEAVKIAEDLINNAVGDEAIFEGIKRDLKTARANSKLSQRNCYSALASYMRYGEDYVNSSTLSNEELDALTSEAVLQSAKDLMSEGHYVIYYGSESESNVASIIKDNHALSTKEIPDFKSQNCLTTPKPVVYLCQYDSPQIYYQQYSCDGTTFNKDINPQLSIYNEYFGGGMNSIVFQEMREARGLAYSASASYSSPSIKDNYYAFSAFIATQNDKMQQAIEAFDDIINNMPESEAAFKIAKEGLISR